MALSCERPAQMMCSAARLRSRTPLLPVSAGSSRLDIPDSITLCPCRHGRRSSVRYIWHFMRDNGLSNRVFGSFDEILAHCKARRPALANHVHGLRYWARGF